MIRREASQQMWLFPDHQPVAPQVDLTSTFVDNLALPIHRWFRYSAGFSALWVRGLIEQEKANGRCRVFDPFVGSGTVVLEGELCGVQALGLEPHPFIARVARTKLQWREDPLTFQNYALSMLQQAKKRPGTVNGYPPLITRCFSENVLVRLDSLRHSHLVRADGSPLSELAWLALASILRECSQVGTAQWQYVLPNKHKVRTVDPYAAFETKIRLMSGDMAVRQRQTRGPIASVQQEDARTCRTITEKWADLVITSPPYMNNYDYADATRLEMSFFGEIKGWGDLQDTVRRYLIRSCTQHIVRFEGEARAILEDPVLRPIASELVDRYNQLEQTREKHGGRKPYHTMAVSYFHDMAHVWLALRRVATSGALVCLVIGDSAPYGIHIPVEQWFGKLAIAAGFKSYSFEKTRDRNVKWKNRKHRVPLCEGRLWVVG